MRHVVLLAASLSLVACGGGSAPIDARAAASGASATAKPRVIVADIDSGTNPYHSMFYAGSPIYKDHAPDAVTQEVLDDLGVPPENVIELTRTGNIAKDKKADEAKWAAVRRGKPYWFKGTNIIGISFSSAAPFLMPDAAKNPHGVGTETSVLTANPDAVMLFVETWDNLGADEAHAYAFLNPAVDVITTSYGAGLPLVPVSTGVFLPETSAFASTYDGVVGMGKMHFSSGGNSPGYTPLRAGAGPWWSIGIDGSEEGTSEGKQILSGNIPDFVADFTQDLAYCVDCERGTESVGGTSFSTPTSAGVTSKIILEARRATGHLGGIDIVNGVPLMVNAGGKQITNWQVRRAMEEAAWVAGPTDFDPTAADTAYPVPPVLAFLAVGWGELTVNPEKGVVTEALAQLGFGTPTRTKDTGFCEWQTLVIKHRKAYWDNVALDSADRTPPATDPFLFCNSAVPFPALP